MRKPHLIASNTGISANIDTCGRLVETGPKREEAVIRVEVKPTQRSSFYRQHGEAIPIGFAIVCGFAGLFSLFTRASDAEDPPTKKS